MVKQLFFILFASTLFFSYAHAQFVPPGYILTFSDEFNAPILNLNSWNTVYPFGDPNATTLAAANGSRTFAGQMEAEIIMDPLYKGSCPYALGVNPYSFQGDTALIITADTTSAALKSCLFGMPYTSGAINTYQKFTQQYGFFVMRAKLPTGRGLWPAFWTLAEDLNWPPEIDIEEVLGNTSDTVYQTIHLPADTLQYPSFAYDSGINTSIGFHEFAVEWTPTETKWYFDGKLTETVPYGIRKPMYLLVSLAVGNTGSWPGLPDAGTKFPAQMVIDYVRAYAKSNTPDAITCKATDTPVIDGIAESSWNSIASMPLINVTDGLINAVAAENFSANYKATWDSTALYLFVNVADDTLLNASASTPWNGDAVEVFIDGYNTKSGTYDISDRQYLFRWNDNNVYQASNAVLLSNNPTGVSFKQVTNGTSYQMEIKISWSALELVGYKGKLFGLDVHVDGHSSGSNGNRFAKLSWIAKTDQSSSNTALFGTMQLGTDCNTITTSVTDIMDQGQATIYPNPSSTGFTLSVRVGTILDNTVINLYDLTGKKIKTVSINSYETIISRDKLANGIYFYNLTNKDGRIAQGKVILQ